MNTRTVLLWHNNGQQQLTFAVNPAELSVSRPNCNRTASLAMGGTVNVWGGRDLREVRLTTFLPGEDSPFFDGLKPLTALSMLRRWQDSGDPVRLILSGTDINDAFLIENVTETFREGDRDVEVSIALREYKFKSALAALAAGQAASAGYGGALALGPGGASAAAGRLDERILPDSWTVKRGDTLWSIACTLYGDGTRWRSIAAKNGITEPRKLQIGRILVL